MLGLEVASVCKGYPQCFLGFLCPLRRDWRSIRALWTTLVWPATTKVRIQPITCLLPHWLVKPKIIVFKCLFYLLVLHKQVLCPACSTWPTSFMMTPKEESWQTPTVEVKFKHAGLHSGSCWWNLCPGVAYAVKHGDVWPQTCLLTKSWTRGSTETTEGPSEKSISKCKIRCCKAFN